jgi:hypothetical protein
MTHLVLRLSGLVALALISSANAVEFSAVYSRNRSHRELLNVPSATGTVAVSLHLCLTSPIAIIPPPKTASSTFTGLPNQSPSKKANPSSRWTSLHHETCRTFVDCIQMSIWMFKNCWCDPIVVRSWPIPS